MVNDEQKNVVRKPIQFGRLTRSEFMQGIRQSPQPGQRKKFLKDVEEARQQFEKFDSTPGQREIQIDPRYIGGYF